MLGLSFSAHEILAHEIIQYIILIVIFLEACYLTFKKYGVSIYTKCK